MARKNYRTKGARKRHTIEYVVADPHGEYSVLLTNGSGFTTVTVVGTGAQCWSWAERAGAHGGIKPGVWWPINAELVRKTPRESFTLL